MAFARGFVGGAAVDGERPARVRPPGPQQIISRRCQLWLIAYEDGLPDPVTRETRRYGQAEIALLWGVTKRAVEMGLKRAREAREKLSRLPDA